MPLLMELKKMSDWGVYYNHVAPTGLGWGATRPNESDRPGAESENGKTTGIWQASGRSGQKSGF
jgi:hypothetical protein